MIGYLADIAYLEGCISSKLVLDRQVDLVVEGRLHIPVPETEYGPSKARVVWTRKTRWGRRNNPIRCSRIRQGLKQILRLEFASCRGSPVKRWIYGQAQVGARPF